MTNTAQDLILTIALHHASNIKVLHAIEVERKDLAREFLTARIENDITEAPYLADFSDIALAPHERAALGVTNMAGPMLKSRIAQVVEAVIPD